MAPASEKSEDKAIVILWVILLVLICVSVALAGLLLVRRLVPLPVREPANDVSGIIYGATYVLYRITPYARAVLEEEWPLMERGEESQESPQAEVVLDELQSTVVGYEPNTSAEQALYSQGITLAFDVGDEREIRLHHSSQDSHRLLWHVLVSGGVVTVLLSFFFGSKVAWLQGLSVAALTTLVVLILSATYQLQAPFAGRYE